MKLTGIEHPQFTGLHSGDAAGDFCSFANLEENFKKSEAQSPSFAERECSTRGIPGADTADRRGLPFSQSLSPV